MAQRNQDHNFMNPGVWNPGVWNPGVWNPGVWRRTGATLVMMLGLGLRMSGCSVLSVFSPFGDFGDDGNDVVLIENGDLSRQALSLPTPAVAVPTANPALLLAAAASSTASPTAAPTATPAVSAAGAWRPSDELRDDVRR